MSITPSLAVHGLLMIFRTLEIADSRVCKVNLLFAATGDSDGLNEDGCGNEDRCTLLVD